MFWIHSPQNKEENKEENKYYEDQALPCGRPFAYTKQSLIRALILITELCDSHF